MANFSFSDKPKCRGQWIGYPALRTVLYSFPSYGSPLDLCLSCSILSSHLFRFEPPFLLQTRSPVTELAACAFTRRFKVGLSGGFEPFLSSWYCRIHSQVTGFRGLVFPLNCPSGYVESPFTRHHSASETYRDLPPLEPGGRLLSSSALYWWLRPRFTRISLTGLPSLTGIGGSIP